jgi:hypothetical protein
VAKIFNNYYLKEKALEKGYEGKALEKENISEMFSGFKNSKESK